VKRATSLVLLLSPLFFLSLPLFSPSLPFFPTNGASKMNGHQRPSMLCAPSPLFLFFFPPLSFFSERDQTRRRSAFYSSFFSFSPFLPGRAARRNLRRGVFGSSISFFFPLLLNKIPVNMICTKYVCDSTCSSFLPFFPPPTTP